MEDSLYQYDGEVNEDSTRPGGGSGRGEGQGESEATTSEAGMSPIEASIESGDLARISAMLEGMESSEVFEILTSTYSVSSGRKTTPLLRTARKGNPDVFATILDALEESSSPKQVADAVRSTDESGETILRAVAASGSKDTLQAVIEAMTAHLTSDEVVEMIRSTGSLRGGTILSVAVDAGDNGALELVFKMMWDYLDHHQVADMIAAIDVSGNTILHVVAKNGRRDMIEAVMRTLTKLPPRKAKELFRCTNYNVWGGVGDTVLMGAMDSGRSEAVEAVMDAAAEILDEDEVEDMIMAGTPEQTTALDVAARHPDRKELVHAMMIIMLEWLSPAQANFMLGKVFQNVRRIIRHEEQDELLAILACFAHHGILPESHYLIELGRVWDEDRLKKCFIGAVVSAKNPFVPGMTLSVAITEAIRLAPEGSRRKLSEVQESVEMILLEIFERLPQTVRGFTKANESFSEGMEDCCELFEPKMSFARPLSVALMGRHQMLTFCTVPLLVDFMSRKFTLSLPDLLDTEELVKNNNWEIYLPVGSGAAGIRDSLVLKSLDGSVSYLGERLQGVGKYFNSLTYLRGAQFIVAGVVAKPNSYYKIPAMRMALDLLVYLSMLVIFSTRVLLYEGVALTASELTFAVYIVAALLTEVRELRTDIGLYKRDYWNIVDILALSILCTGMIFRAVDGTSSWGRALYASGAPLVVSRLLFFLQALPFQGPMVQVIFSMTGELLRFGIFVVVIILGFVLSFYALLRENGKTYGETWLGAFEAMIGELRFFDDLDESDFSTVGTILLVVYLNISAVMLLNLLVAVLSTAHARVDENLDVEFKVSKARIIQQYRRVVAKDLLPPPFNVIQLVVAIPFKLLDCCYDANMFEAVRKAVGHAVFWFYMGSFCAVSGALLWIVSLPRVVVVVFIRTRRMRSGGLSQWLLWCVPWSLVGAPLCFIGLWLWHIPECVVVFASSLRKLAAQLFGTINRVAARRLARRHLSGIHQASPLATEDPECMDDPKWRDSRRITVEEALRESPGGLGVRQLREYLEDPMSDPEVRQDETERPTTVEHIKLLRNRLEIEIVRKVEDKVCAMVEKRVSELEGRLQTQGAETAAILTARVDKLQQTLDAILKSVQ